MGDIFVKQTLFPTIRIHGVTGLDENGDYTILIDERLSDEIKLETYAHEMKHIQGNHFSGLFTAKEAEDNT